MPTQFDRDLNRLKESLLKMGAIAEQMIRDIIAVITDSDTSLIDSLEKNEEIMDQLQIDVDEETVRLIGVHTPVAGDLRLLLMITRINAELERVADKVMDIAFYAQTLLKEEPLKPMTEDIPRIAAMAAKSIKRALDAFTEKSTKLAISVIRDDDRLDDLHDHIFRELMTHVTGNPAIVSRVFELILISRSFERIADHAVNIAEDVVYMVKGKDIRHWPDDGPDLSKEPV